MFTVDKLIRALEEYGIHQFGVCIDRDHMPVLRIVHTCDTYAYAIQFEFFEKEDGIFTEAKMIGMKDGNEIHFIQEVFKNQGPVAQVLERMEKVLSSLQIQPRRNPSNHYWSSHYPDA